jgi:proteasome accessory factor B
LAEKGRSVSAKSERLLNLVILLLVARNYTTKEQIRALMEPYRASSDEAFDRMFERDKDDLRALGIPLEVGFVDKFFEDEQGYRIKRDAFELPAIDFSADEVAVLGLAARVWRHAGLAAATSDALMKLRAAGLSFDREQLDHVQPTLAPQDPAFEPLWQATVHRTPVQFDYSRAGQRDVTTRHVQPWGVITTQGRWYVAGLDTDRGEPRMFRLSRVVSDVVATGEPGSFSVPEGTDLRALSQSLTPREADRSAVVLARAGAAIGLRRRAEITATGVTGPDGTPGWDQLAVPYVSQTDFAGELLGYADAVVVESPAELRSAVSARLADVVQGAAR